MTMWETGIMLIVILAIVVSVTGGPPQLVYLWHNWFIGKKYYRWVEVGLGLLIIVGVALMLIGAVIGGFNGQGN